MKDSGGPEWWKTVSPATQFFYARFGEPSYTDDPFRPQDTDERDEVAVADFEQSRFVDGPQCLRRAIAPRVFQKDEGTVVSHVVIQEKPSCRTEPSLHEPP